MTKKNRPFLTVLAALGCAAVVFACNSDTERQLNAALKANHDRNVEAAEANKLLVQQEEQLKVDREKSKELDAKIAQADAAISRLHSALFTVAASDFDADPKDFTTHAMCTAVVVQRLDNTIVLNTSDARCSFTQSDVRRRHLEVYTISGTSPTKSFPVSRVTNFEKNDIYTTALVVDAGKHADEIRTMWEVIERP